MSLPRTPSQTVGPFFDFGLCARPASELVDAGSPGAIQIEGVVLDGAGAPVPDGLVEIWQADAAGTLRRRLRLGALRDRRRRPLRLHDRQARSGAGAGRERPGAPHQRAVLLARPAQAGADPPLLPRRGRGNADDRVLRSIAGDDERATLVARATAPGRYGFDITLQGDGPDGLLHDAGIRAMTFSRLDGPADAPVLVLSNSLGTTLALWDLQMPALKEHFSVLRYDHPGHGLGSRGRSRPSRSSGAACSRSSTGTRSSASRSAASRSAGPSACGSR